MNFAAYFVAIPIHRTPMHAAQTKASIGFFAQLLTQSLALLFCVGVPALVTMIAPVSWVSFQRDASGVTARVQTCLLFIVPFKTAVIQPVLAVNEHVLEGSIRIKKRIGTDKKYQAEDEGFLLIRGPDQLAKVQVSPVDLTTTLAKVEAFLAQADATELKLFVVANWKFSVLGGALVSMLTLLYLVGVSFGLLRAVLRAMGMFKA